MLARAKTPKRVERMSAFMCRGVGREGDEVLQVEPDADLLADSVVVVAPHQAEKAGVGSCNPAFMDCPRERAEGVAVNFRGKSSSDPT
jgi:hypothetical protein